MDSYLSPLEEGDSLELFDESGLIFRSGGKWLHPLFEAESFLKGHEVKGMLSVHDSIAGCAAAFLGVRLGVRHVNIDMISDAAIEVYKRHGVEVHYTKRVERIKCVTETMISPDMAVDEAYKALRRKAGLTSGIPLRIDKLCFSYGTKKILDGLSLYLEKGDAVLLEGENGSGKTTLLRLILGLEKPSSGQILYDGSPAPPPIGYVKQFKEGQGFPFSCREVVALTLPEDAVDKEGEVELALRRTGAWHLADRCFFSLSGGEKARVDLARVLASKAKLLLLDEPTASLDKESRVRFADMISSLSTDEMPTMILVNHDRLLSEALSWPRLCLEGGHLA